MLTFLLISLVISLVLGVIGLVFRASLKVIKCFYPVMIAGAAYYAYTAMGMELLVLIPAALAVCLVFYLVTKLF